MSKTAKSADVFAFPTFDATAMSDQFREFTEKSVAQSKEAYAKMKEQAEATQKAMEEAFETVHANSSAVALKAIAAARANTESSFSHLEALFGVKTFAEAIELQTAFVRKQAELFTDQAKVLHEAASKAAEEVAKPVKAAYDKAMKDIKVA
jgi:phasin